MVTAEDAVIRCFSFSSDVFLQLASQWVTLVTLRSRCSGAAFGNERPLIPQAAALRKSKLICPSLNPVVPSQPVSECVRLLPAERADALPTAALGRQDCAW